MFLEGHLIYFTPFYFKNGNEPDNKFFIVLKNFDSVSILASLPTKVNNAPTLINANHGCINHDDRLFNCYLFESGRVVCDNGFSFDLPTFIYGNQVEDYNISILTKNETIVEGKDYKLVGVLIKPEFQALIDCISNSKGTKGRIKRLLAS